MRGIVKLRWLVLILWIAAAVGLMVIAPDMGELVREKGQLTVPDGYSSSIAYEILKDNNEKNATDINLVLVFHNENQLTDQDYDQALLAIETLEDHQEALGIKSITSSLRTPELKSQLESADQKTIMALLTVDVQDRTIAEVREDLENVINHIQIEHYYTGGELVNEDVIINSEQGLRKTEVITVVFILIILLIVFRSPVTPIVPLATVGLTYLVSQSVVAFLIEFVDFPVSNFTQIFLVAVLFGIGTDYSILLLSRFKEELEKQDDVLQAILQTYKTAGKTVFYSSIAALLGFSLIGLAQFQLYQSAVAVAVGIFFLIIALFTLIPFFMGTFGKKLFWPIRGKLKQKESKLWGTIGRFAIARPIIVMAILAVIVLPLLITYDRDITYSSLNEISDDFGSVKGFNIVADSFGPGEVMPSTVVIEYDQPLDTKEGLVFIERLSREIEKLPEIEKVRSATRPLGEVLEDFAVTSQVELLDEGLGEGNEGLVLIRDGLAEANTKLGESEPLIDEAVNGIAQLIDGTSAIKDGVIQLRDGLTQLAEGIQSGALGAEQIQAGIQEAVHNAQLLQASANQLLSGYEQLGSGVTQLHQEYSKLQAGLQQLSTTLSSLDQNFTNLIASYPQLQQNIDFLTIQGTVTEAKNGLTTIGAGFNALNAELEKVAYGLSEANTAFTQIVQGLEAFASGLEQLNNGMGELAGGLHTAADAQQHIITQLPVMIAGLDQLIDGQSQAQEGFSEFSSQLGVLRNGLSDSVDGLTQISDGLMQAKLYLSDLASATDAELSGWNIPEEAFTNEQFQQVLDQYMSENRYVTTIDLIFKDDPYSLTSLHAVTKVQDVIEQMIEGTKYETIRYGISGISGTFSDLEQISSEDYDRTMMLMLIGITIMLIVMLRSMVMPIYILISLMITYFTSMSVAELIFVTIFGFDGIGWAIPFFGFVILLALGVDYSIFLMDRFNEHRDLPVTEAIQLAMRKMGTVIISAGIILAGTFAAMMPSGVQSLLQIATVMLFGLILYALVFLPLFIPVMVKLFGKYNWWPFTRKSS